MDTKSKRDEIIHLQSAHVTQLSENGSTGDWMVKQNITGDILQVLPDHYNESEMFQILDFARHYELIAFNEGIKFQKRKQNDLLKSKIDELQTVIDGITVENEILATVLDKHIAKKMH